VTAVVREDLESIIHTELQNTDLPLPTVEFLVSTLSAVGAGDPRGVPAVPGDASYSVRVIHDMTVVGLEMVGYFTQCASMPPPRTFAELDGVAAAVASAIAARGGNECVRAARFDAALQSLTSHRNQRR
jgi:hypothetical protein